MIDLTTCVKGQKLRLRDGTVIMYNKRITFGDNYSHEAIDRYSTLQTYTDWGSYYADCGPSNLDVVEILPLETTKPASHPSVAWWESCPWITDRRPTEEDADEFGRVLVKPTEPAKIQTTFFQDVRIKEAWIHHGNWQPPVLSDKEKALELINNHSPGGNGIVEDNWKPTTEQWLVIRKGLEAS
jgi:hypothetical protein